MQIEEDFLFLEWDSKETARVNFTLSTVVGAAHSNQTTAQLVVVPFGQQPNAVWC